jgi:hypothetical protein
MSEKSGSWLGYASIIIAAIPIFIGVYEYNANNQREFGKNFLNQKKNRKMHGLIPTQPGGSS